MPDTGRASPSPGLCGTCVHARILHSDRGAGFYRCALSDTDPRYARYPRLPVVRCEGYDQTPTPATGTERP
jgi:hypothetical protein